MIIRELQPIDLRLGVIPGGFMLKNGTYEDIIPHYYILRKDE